MRLEDDTYSVISNPNYRQYMAPEVEQLTDTSISVRIYTAGMVLTPSSYKVTYKRVISSTVDGGYSPTTINDINNPKTITGLVNGAMYQIKTQAMGPGSGGNELTVYFQITKPATDPSVIKGREDYPSTTYFPSSTFAFDDRNLESGSITNASLSQTKTVSNISYLKLVGGKNVDNLYTYAYKDFDSITLPGGSTLSDGFIEYASGQEYHYGFGTSFIFPPIAVYEPQEAGIGFFVSPKAASGYYVTFSTSRTAGAKNESPIKIIKLKGRQIITLSGSPSSKNTALNTLFSGTTHNMDIKVKVKEDTVTITAYINGYEVKAIDKNVDSGVKPNAILPITKKVSLLAASGTVSFDYVYATDLKNSEYDTRTALNPYEGQFSNDYLKAQYGDIVYFANNEDAREEDLKSSYDEFGAVAREIVRRKVSFGGGAAFPNSWTTGANKRVKILSQDRSHFGADVFVINNTSTSAPLADGSINSFAVIGSKIGFSGDIEYFTDPPSEYAVAEPVTFNSLWLQDEKDVENLADWIKSKVVNKAKIIEMDIFGNPLLSVGDIITVKYDYQEFDGTEKIIITGITHEYDGGLTTKIRGRTI